MKKIILLLLCLNILACSKTPPPLVEKEVDTVLIGGGIMSATLGTLLKELEPTMTIAVYERLGSVAFESSAAMNNAGTGHSAFCELNYTPEKSDGTIETKKAVEINELFEISKQFWAYQVSKQILGSPQSFINNTPHMSFVWGDDNIKYLRKRYEALSKEPLFQGMLYSEAPEQLKKWVPLMMEGRDPQQKVAATYMDIGTDVNYGAITGQLFTALNKQTGFETHTRHEVQDLVRSQDDQWIVVVKNLDTNKVSSIKAKFVFIGAGGGALPLLQKSGIKEAKGYGGFPVGGEWLVTKNPEIVTRHEAKAYGKASVGSPPMSVPHLDTRIIDGEKAILFGPYATFSTKYLKMGSLLDLPKSIRLDNIWPMIKAGIDNIPLTKYLVGQLLQTDEARFATLKEYFPNAQPEDWTLELAGQRVQIIKKDSEKGGVLQFGTEVVVSEDGSMSALLGASPGASTAAPIMLTLLEKAFPEKIKSPDWNNKLKEIIPSYGQSLNKDIALANKTRAWSSKLLQLKYHEIK